MANKGLKEYTKQISQTIGDVAKVSINVNKEDANMHIIIPLFQTLGPNPIDLSLIFNYQDINKDRAFGKGCNLSTFKDIKSYSNRLEIFDADGSCVTYTPDASEYYFSKETSLKVTKEVVYFPGDGDYDTFYIEDQQGNEMSFDETYTFYPTAIQYKNGFRTTFNGPNMDNNYGAKVTFTETSNYMYSRATYTQDGNTLYYVDFEYDSNQRLASVKHYKESKLIKHLSITYNSSYIIVNDVICNVLVKYAISDKRIYSITEMLNGQTSSERTTTIFYEDRRTKITNQEGNYVFVYFDSNNLPLFEIDQVGNSIKSKYDSITKRLISFSPVIPTKNKLLNLSDITIANFIKSSGNVTTSPTSVNDSILASNLGTVYIGGIQLLKKNFGVIYSYDTNGNMTNMETGTGTIFSSYDNKGQKTSFLGFDSTFCDYEYDTKGNQISAKTAFGGKIENTYDIYNNVTKRVASNTAATKKLEVTKTYENGRFISSEKDYLGNETKYLYDSFGKIKKVTDVLNATMEYQYDEFDNLIKILFNNTDSVSYTYDSQNKLKTATLSNGTVYSFGYDSCNNLNLVSMNGVLIVTFTYDQKTGLIKNQKLGSSGDFFTFVYDAKKLYVTELHYNGNLKYKFTYDAYNRMKEVRNKNNDVLKEVEYNNDGHVVKVKENDSCVDYGYDALGNINQKKKTISSKTSYESFDNISKSKGFHPEAIKTLLYNDSDYVGCLFDKDASLKNQKYTIKPEMYNGSSVYKSCTKNGFVPCVYVDSSYTMSYALPMGNTYPLDTGCVAFWFKPTSNGIKYLFSVKSKNRYDYIGVFIDTTGNLVLEVTDYKNNSQILITTTGKVKLNDWNFFGLSFMNRNDEYYSTDVCEYALFLNAETKMYKKENPRLIVEPNSGNYHIGYKYNGTSATYGLNSYITALMIGCKQYITVGAMQEFYRHTKDYIFGLSYLQDNAVDFSTTTLYNISDTMLDQFDVFPLQNNVKSLKGTLPIAFDLRRVTDLDKDRTFNYNNKIRRYAYVADGKRLEYKLDMSTTGTIMMRIYFMENVEKQCVLQCKDSSNKTIGLCRNANGYLQIEINGIYSTTNLKVSVNEWHTIGFSFCEGSISSSAGNSPIKTVRVYLDGSVTSLDKEISSSFGELTLSVGRQFKEETTLGNIGYFTTCYAMIGQIEMLATRASFCEVSTLNTLSSELKPTTKVLEYDELGMLQKEVTRNADSDILVSTYSYKKRSTNSSFISKLIEKEEIKYGATTVNRNYITDAIGNVKSITDSVFGSHSYAYNERDFLIEEDGKKYEYDNNGNIKKAGSTTFSYDSTIKDRLKSVNGKEITYGSNPLNPSSYNGNTYEFEGRKLVKFNNYAYTYNAQGLRICKNINNSLTHYYYDGDKLITEINSNCRLDFLYDENDNLYGFIHNRINKYFYIRDIYANILGLVDNGGNLVVKYNCDAWGNHKVLDGNGNVNTSDSFIGNINPFRYKGYYYDKESKMYYCKSRYYVPEWCRWLNADSIVFNFSMGFGAINGCNTFNYCFNNPIMYIDEDGLFPMKSNYKKSGWNELGKRGKFRFDDFRIDSKAHIHVTYDNKEYSWYKDDHNKRHETDLGLEDLPGSAEKALKAKGIPDEYFDDIEFLLPSIEYYLETFPSVEKEPTITIPEIPEKKPNGIETFPLNPSQGTFEVFPAPTQSGISIESFGAAIGGAAGLCFCCFLGDYFLGDHRFKW